MNYRSRLFLMLEHGALPLTYRSQTMNMNELLSSISYTSERDRLTFLSRLAMINENVAFMPRALTPEMTQARTHYVANCDICLSIDEINEGVYKQYVQTGELKVDINPAEREEVSVLPRHDIEAFIAELEKSSCLYQPRGTSSSDVIMATTQIHVLGLLFGLYFSLGKKMPHYPCLAPLTNDQGEELDRD